MTRPSLNQTNFTAGEISPRMYGRTDIDRYQNAVKGMVNAYADIRGGAIRRAGTLYVDTIPFGDQIAGLVGFTVDRDNSYMLLFGAFYVRIYLPDGTYTGVQLASPYTTTQTRTLDFVQGEDTMFITHKDVPPYRLRSFSSTVWDLSPVPFTVQPFDEQGVSLAANLTLGGTSGVQNVVASAGVFLVSDIGRNIVSSAGIGQITGFTDASHVTITISTAFVSTSLASGSWYLDLSPQAFLRFTDVGPTGALVTVFGHVSRPASLHLGALTGSGITFTAGSSVFSAGDVGKIIVAGAGVATITAQGGTTATVNINTDFTAADFAQGAWGITGNVFRSTDVGSYIRANSGLLKITAFTDATAVTASIVTALDSPLVASPPLAWSLETPIWSPTTGYPRTCTLHEQRLWFGGTPKFPQRVVGSKTGLYLDFTKGDADTDACDFTIASDQINPISYLATSKELLIHTFNGEFSMRGGNEKPITPTNVQIKPQGTLGSTLVRPLTVGKESVFVQRSGLKVRALSYNFAIDGYNSRDLTILADHITASGITSTAWQQEPYQLIWATLADGTLLTCALDVDQQVTAWSRNYTDGAFEWVEIIPDGDFDQVWVLVRRTIGGEIVRYLERFDATFQPTFPDPQRTAGYPPYSEAVVYGCTVDSGKVFSSFNAFTTISLPHLVGETVDIVADGAAMPPQTVPIGGTVTLPREAFCVVAGLHFESRIDMLTPEAGTPSGTAQGNSMRIGEITLRFNNTLGAKVFDGEGDELDVPFRQFGTGILDAIPKPFAGLMRLEKLGWERGRAEISIVQDQPLPMQLLSVIRKMSIND